MEGALRESSPVAALVTLAKSLKAEGMAQVEMLRLFDGYRARYERDADATRYDAILDTMDFISGWGSGGALFNTEQERR